MYIIFIIVVIACPYHCCKHDFCWHGTSAEGLHFSALVTPRTCARGIKQSLCLSVVVVIVGTKITRFRVLGICAHNQSVDISEKLISTCFELLKMAY